MRYFLTIAKGPVEAGWVLACGRAGFRLHRGMPIWRLWIGRRKL